MASRIRRHVRSNIIGYLALLIAMSGTAIAAPPMFTGERIQDGTLNSADLRDRDSTTYPGPSIQGVDLESDTLTGAEIDESTLSGIVPAANSVGTTELSNSIPAVRVSHSTNQTVTGPTTLAFDSELYDTAGMHDAASNNSRLAAPVDGIYLITLRVKWDAVFVRRTIGIHKSGTLGPIAFADSQPNANDTQEVSTQVHLLAGEWVEAVVTRGSTDLPVNVEATGFSEFSMTWLAPGP